MDEVETMLAAARMRDPSITQLMATTPNSAIYELNNGDWVRKFEGSFMLFNRDSKPQYGFLVLDRNRPEFLVELFNDGSSVMNEEAVDAERSKAIRYVNSYVGTEYLLAFESRSVAQCIFQKLKQAVLLVSVAPRSGARRVTQPQNQPQRRSVDAALEVSQSSCTAQGDQPVSGSNKLLLQLMAAKSNYHATQGALGTDAESNSLSKKPQREKVSKKREQAVSSPPKPTVVTQVHSSNAGGYYAKPSVMNVSLNSLSIANGAKADVRVAPAKQSPPFESALPEVRYDSCTDAAQRSEMNSSPSRMASRMQPISLTQLFANASLNASGGNTVVLSEATTPAADALPAAAPSVDSSSLPTSNGNCVSEDDSGASGSYLASQSRGPLDSVDSDTLLIAPHAFVARDTQADENRVLLDMIMMRRESGCAALEHEAETDMRVELGRSGTDTGTRSGTRSSGNDEDGPSSSRGSNSSGNPDAEGDAEAIQRISNNQSLSGVKKTRHSRRSHRNRAPPLTTAQLRATLIELLENDDEFVERLHQNYTRLLTRPMHDVTHH